MRTATHNAVAALWLAAIVAVAGAAGASQATGKTLADVVIDRILDRNPGLTSYQAHAHVNIRQLNFPFLHPSLDGSAYYTWPGAPLYDFPDAPSYLGGLTTAQAAVGLVNRWRACYNISARAKGNQYVLHMVPKIPGQVSSVDVVVARNDASIRHVDWYYHDSDDYITLDQTYSKVNGYSIVRGQKSMIVRHGIRAESTSMFDQFKMNVPVPTPTPTPSDPLHHCDN